MVKESSNEQLPGMLLQELGFQRLPCICKYNLEEMRNTFCYSRDNPIMSLYKRSSTMQLTGFRGSEVRGSFSVLKSFLFYCEKHDVALN